MSKLHQLESRMRETRLSGLEGGAGYIPVPTPITVSLRAMRGRRRD